VAWFWDELRDGAMARVTEDQAAVRQLEADVAAGTITPAAAAERLLSG
jgi:hypothetical protein